MLVGIPEILCDLAVKDFLAVSPMDAGIKDNTLINHKIRNTTIRFIEENHWMTGVMYHIGLQANKFHDWNLDVDSFQQIQYAEYEDGQHYNWHIDTFLLSGQPLDRKITAICLLNYPQEFEGGELQIKEEVIPLKKGSVIAFPSFYPHRVTSVTKGIRRSATLWITGPAFR
jgi:PKHD-type hydroxylase